jgi:hypothetical protein
MRGQHHSERLVPNLLVSRIFKTAEARHPAIVDQNVDPAEVPGDIPRHGGAANTAAGRLDAAALCG